MPFVKLVKNNAYFKRYQVKNRRRREGKTDYAQRRALIIQDKNKYTTPKFRFVVRFTNTTVICQIIHSEIDGDRVLSSAYSSELPRYGLKVGLKNYAAAYCTGLLCARRTLAKLGMAETYKGTDEVNGNVNTSTDYTDSGREKTYWVADTIDAERRPFRAFLDVGVRATTTGARLFGALKGAVDGGLDIPHNEKRFPGYDRESKEYDASFHRDRIFGQHVGEYMDKLKEENNDKFNKQFGEYIKAGVASAEDLESLYQKVHAAIRADPSASAKKETAPDKKWKNKAKLTLQQRKNRVQEKIQSRLRQLQAAAEE